MKKIFILAVLIPCINSAMMQRPETPLQRFKDFIRCEPNNAALLFLVVHVFTTENNKTPLPQTRSSQMLFSRTPTYLDTLVVWKMASDNGIIDPELYTFIKNNYQIQIPKDSRKPYVVPVKTS